VGSLKEEEEVEEEVEGWGKGLDGVRKLYLVPKARNDNVSVLLIRSILGGNFCNELVRFRRGKKKRGSR